MFKQVEGQGLRDGDQRSEDGDQRSETRRDQQPRHLDCYEFRHDLVSHYFVSGSLAFDTNAGMETANCAAVALRATAKYSARHYGQNEGCFAGAGFIAWSFTAQLLPERTRNLIYNPASLWLRRPHPSEQQHPQQIS